MSSLCDKELVAQKINLAFNLRLVGVESSTKVQKEAIKAIKLDFVSLKLEIEILKEDLENEKNSIQESKKLVQLKNQNKSTLDTISTMHISTKSVINFRRDQANSSSQPKSKSQPKIEIANHRPVPKNHRVASQSPIRNKAIIIITEKSVNTNKHKIIAPIEADQRLLTETIAYKMKKTEKHEMNDKELPNFDTKIEKTGLGIKKLDISERVSGKLKSDNDTSLNSQVNFKKNTKNLGELNSQFSQSNASTIAIESLKSAKKKDVVLSKLDFSKVVQNSSGIEKKEMNTSRVHNEAVVNSKIVLDNDKKIVEDGEAEHVLSANLSPSINNKREDPIVLIDGDKKCLEPTLPEPQPLIIPQSTNQLSNLEAGTNTEVQSIDLEKENINLTTETIISDSPVSKEDEATASNPNPTIEKVEQASSIKNEEVADQKIIEKDSCNKKDLGLKSFEEKYALYLKVNLYYNIISLKIP